MQKKYFNALTEKEKGVVRYYINKRRNDPERESKKDILSILLKAHDDQTGQNITNEELEDNLRVFISAGFETTAHTLVWFLYHLSIYPEYQQKLQKEVDSILGSNMFPTAEQLPELKLLSCFINESIRLLPVAATTQVRETDQELELCGYKLPKGTEVCTITLAAHLNPKYWENPKEFKPERFENSSNPSFIPFSMGPRNCIGQTLAMYELKVIGCAIVKNFNVKLVPDQKVEPEIIITMRPKNGLKVVFEPRNS